MIPRISMLNIWPAQTAPVVSLTGALSEEIAAPYSPVSSFPADPVSPLCPGVFIRREGGDAGGGAKVSADSETKMSIQSFRGGYMVFQGEEWAFLVMSNLSSQPWIRRRLIQEDFDMVRCLFRVGSRDADFVIQKFLSHPDYAHLAAEALVRIGRPATVPLLRAMLKGASVPYITSILEEMAKPWVRPTKLLASERDVVAGLIEFGSWNIEFVMNVMMPGGRMADLAAEALIRIGAPAMAPLRRSLKDRNALPNVQAILREIRTARDTGPLKEKRLKARR